MHVDVKVSVWQRIQLPETVSKEDIIDILKDGDINELFEKEDGISFETMVETEEYLTPADNDSQSTIEFYETAGDKNLIWTNAIPALIVTPPEPTYVLLGNDAVNIFGNDGIKGLVKAIKKDTEYMAYEIQKFTQNASIADVLGAADGWGSYAFLTKKEYKKLESL